ncbi:MAG: AAA family ATPase [Granulosicoccus sp.]
MQDRTVSNHEELIAIVKQRMLESARIGQRAIIVLHGAPSGWLENFTRCHGIFLLEEISEKQRADRADKITALLGSERLLVAYAFANSVAAPDASLFAAATGSLRAGGVLLLDPGVAQAVETHSAPAKGSASGLTVGPQSNFRKRFEQLLLRESSKSPAWISKLEYVANSLCGASNHDCNVARRIVPDAFDLSTKYERPALQEQTEILQQITRHFSINEQSSTLISGRRGRGKSTLLARLANSLEAQGVDFAITANHQSALSSFREHFSGQTKRIISHMEAMQCSHEMLLVDEAGNLSVRQLSTLIGQHRHVVFCSTSEGYENAGRAFINRFSKELAESDRPSLQVELHLPWRWAQNDRLENFVDDLLLCKVPDNYQSRIDAIQRTTHDIVKSCTYRRVSQSELACNDDLLHNIYHLLSGNHYQSSIKDLQHLLDSKSMQVWMGVINETVVAALVLELEGCIDPELHEDIVEQKRRLPHQLLPQMLAVKTGITQILDKRYARVVRIAVTTPLRRRGLASGLLQAMEKALMIDHQAVMAVGASFASDTRSRDFWKSNDYSEFHQGLKVNPRSGTTSVFVMKSDDNDIELAVSSLDAV